MYKAALSPWSAEKRQINDGSPEESRPESKRAFLGRTRIELGFSVVRQKCIARIMSNENVWDMVQHCAFLLHDDIFHMYIDIYVFTL